MSKELADRLHEVEFILVNLGYAEQCGTVSEAIAALRSEPSRESRAELAASGQLSAEQIEHERDSYKGGYGVDDAKFYTLCDMALSSLRGTFTDGIEAAAKALASIPVREEKLGGQTTKYIQRDEAIDTVRALAQGD